MTCHSNNPEEEQAREEYSKVIKTLKQDGLGSWSGEWEDRLKPNKFGRETLIKGDKHKYLKYYKDQQKIIKDGLNLTIDNDDTDDEYDF